MGFRCPLCKKDFKDMKKDFETHIKQCNFGLAETLVSDIRNICEKETEGGNIAGIDTRKPI